MQRATDAQFLRTLARRAGKLFRVFCTDTPGQRTGFFAAPNLSASPAVTLVLERCHRGQCVRTRHRRST